MEEGEYLRRYALLYFASPKITKNNLWYIAMSKKKNTKQYKNGITLKELIDRGDIDKYYHLQEQRFVGGLSMPNKMNSWWKRVDEISSK